MSKTMLDVINDEHKDKGLVDIPFLKDRMAASLGGHTMNLYNLDMYSEEKTRKDAFYNYGELENFRLHMVMMAPSGFGKTLNFKFILHPSRGLLRETSYYPTTVRGTFSPESWAGTAVTDKNTGESKVKNGVFSRFKRGIVGADEFMRFVGMMNTVRVQEYSNEEVHLLTGLDSDTLTKDLSTAPIEIDGIGTTLWSGSRITSIDMRHGLARRVLFQIFIPTPEICAKFGEAIWGTDSAKPIRESAALDLNKATIEAIDDIRLMNAKQFDYSELKDYLQPYKKKLPHFDVALLKRIAVGYSVARNTLPDIVMDEPMIALIEDERRSREIIRNYPEVEIIRRVVSEAGEIKIKDLEEFLSSWYQFTHDYIRQIVQHAARLKVIEKDTKNKSYSLCKKRVQKRLKIKLPLN